MVLTFCIILPQFSGIQYDYAPDAISYPVIPKKGFLYSLIVSVRLGTSYQKVNYIVKISSCCL